MDELSRHGGEHVLFHFPLVVLITSCGEFERPVPDGSGSESGNELGNGV